MNTFLSASKQATSDLATSNLLTKLRQGDFPAVPFAFKAWVTIDGSDYAAVQVAVTQSKREGRAICELAVGSNTRDIGGKKSIPANFLFVRGTPAQVYLEVDQDVGSVDAANGLLLKKGKHLIYDGVVDDGGPSNLSHGRFNLRVVIISNLCYLATGSIQYAGMPTGYLAGGLAGFTRPTSTIKMNGAVAQVDFWDAIKRTYTELINTMDAVGSSAAGQNQLSMFFRAFDPNKTRSVANANLLKAIGGGLPGGIFKDTVMYAAVAAHFNNELKVELSRQSILQRIHALAEDFHFALVEHALGYAVVPYTPFVPRSAIQTVIHPDTVYSAQWNVNSTATIAGVAFIDNLQGCMTNPRNDPTTFAIYGSYSRPGYTAAGKVVNQYDTIGNALGMLTALPAPSWLTAKLTPIDIKKSVEYAIAHAPIDQIRRFGDPYARELALKQNYMGHGLTVECPLRMDIGVCSPVKLIYPDVAGTGLINAAAVYGAVESVTILLDAPSKRAVTVLEIMYARSEQQQIQDVDPGPFGSDPGAPTYLHPVWAEAYLGQRLDEHPAQSRDLAAPSGAA